MKTKPNDGGPAFACASEHFDQSGMSLRAYLAGQALTGLCASSKILTTHEAPWIAERSVAYADALIAELEKEGE